MFLKCDPYRVWCSIFYSKLVNCTLLDHCSFLWKVEEHAVAGKETFKIWIDFRKSPRFSFTSSLSQEREKSSRPVFTNISGTWELLLCEYWRKSMNIGEKDTDLKRLTGRLKLRFLTEIGRLHWNQGEEVAHFAWFGEPWWRHIYNVKKPPVFEPWGSSTVIQSWTYISQCYFMSITIYFSYCWLMLNIGPT
jgi:hypothetical protein